MSICHITSMHDWDDDRIYQRACLGLAREGFEVHLVATKPEIPGQVSTIKLHCIKQRTGIKRRWYSSAEAVQKAIATKADIFHFHDPDLLPHVIRIKKALPNSKVIYDIHENYAGRFLDWGLPAFLGKVFRRYEKAIIARLDGFTAVSESMLKLFEGVKTPSCIIRNSTDVSRLKDLDLNSVDPFEYPTIYTSGTNSHARQCLEAVQALKYVGAAKEFRMMFVGRYQPGLEDELIEQAKKDNTLSILEIEGMLPWEENFKRTARAYAGCVFYADNANNRVTIPNRLYEYMYCGIPVIASDFPELRKVVNTTNCGILVNTEDPEAIGKAIRFLLENEEKAHKMGANGKKAIEEEYGYHIDLERTIEFYQKL